jgi:hypothetical protein
LRHSFFCGWSPPSRHAWIFPGECGIRDGTIWTALDRPLNGQRGLIFINAFGAEKFREMSGYRPAGMLYSDGL